MVNGFLKLVRNTIISKSSFDIEKLDLTNELKNCKTKGMFVYAIKDSFV